MINRSLLFFFFLFPFIAIAQSIHLEEFVILEKYCPGDEYAVVRVLDQDGDDEFKYTWKHNGDSTQTLTIDVKDFGEPFTVARHCPCGTTYESTFVFDPVQLKIGKSTIEKEDISCYEADDGSATVFAHGNRPFRFRWNTGSTSNSISGLSAGKYEVTVYDALGCEQVLNARIKEPSKLKMRPKLLAKNKSYAAVKLNITGGTPGYSLNGESAQKSKFLFSTKKTKRYEFDLEDARGCTSTATIILKKRYKPKSARAVFAKMPKKRKKGKCRLRCPKI